MGAGVSRWTMAHFAVAVASLVAAESLMAGGFVFPVRALGDPFTLAAVHLVAIGWLALLMLGALYQFVPVLVAKPLFSQRLSLISLIALVGGLTGMVGGFASLAEAEPSLALVLPIGGAAVVAGFAVAILNLGLTLWRGRPLPLPARFVAAGLAFLSLTVLLGLVFACALTVAAAPPWASAMLARAVPAHVALGLGGWFTLSAMGVSYRLLSMFMLAPETAAKRAAWVLRTAVTGLVLVLAGALSGADAVAAFLYDAGEALAGLAVALYLLDVLSVYRARCRRTLELNSKSAAAALVALAAAATGFAVTRLSGSENDAFLGAVGFLFVFGWLSGLGLSQLYKIVPFLTWLERFGPRMGRGTVPRVQDLVDERRAASWYLAYFLAVFAAAVAMAASAAAAAQAALALQLVATAFIARELRRARCADVARGPAPTPSTGMRPPPSVPVPHIHTRGGSDVHRTAHT